MYTSIQTYWTNAWPFSNNISSTVSSQSKTALMPMRANSVSFATLSTLAHAQGLHQSTWSVIPWTELRGHLGEAEQTHAKVWAKNLAWHLTTRNPRIMPSVAGCLVADGSFTFPSSISGGVYWETCWHISQHQKSKRNLWVHQVSKNLH